MSQKKDIYVLEVTPSHLKWVRAKVSRAAVQVVDIVAREIPEGQSEHWGSLLAKMVAAKNVPPENVFVVLPRRSVFLKQVSLPAQNPEEMRKMLDLQVSQHVPYPREEVTADFVQLGTDSTGLMKVMMVVVPMAVITQYQEALKVAGLGSVHFVLSSWLLVKRLPSEVVAQEAAAPFIVIDVDEKSVEIGFYRGKDLLFSRTLDFGASDVGGSLNPDCLEQLRLTVATYQREKMGLALQKIFLTGDPERLGRLQKWLEENFSLPVEVIAPTVGFPADESPFKEFYAQFPQLSLSAILGLLSSGQEPIPVVSLPDLEQRVGQRRKSAFFQLAATLALVVIVAGGMGAVQLNKKEQTLRQFEAELAGVKTAAKKAAEKIQGAQIVKDKIRNRVGIPEVVAKLLELAPRGITFRLIQLDEQRALTLEGFGGEGAGVNQFQSQLVHDPFFRDVVLQYATKRKRFDNEFTEFKLTCRLAAGKNTLSAEK